MWLDKAGKRRAFIRLAVAAAEFRRSLAQIMNKEEAKEVLANKLAEYRKLTYQQLVDKIEHIDHFEIAGASGTTYQVSIEPFWDDKPNEIIRVFGSIDDGGWRAFIPMSDDFLVAPDGSFVDE